jgi:CHAT domain-containing protein/tetratricopeptide (TPR) repeat protein
LPRARKTFFAAAGRCHNPAIAPLQKQLLGRSHKKGAAMRVLRIAVLTWLAFVPLGALPCAGQAAGQAADNIDDLQAMNDKAFELHRAGKSADAEALAKRALAEAEQRLGAEAAPVGVLLRSVAVFIFAQAHYDEAEPLLARSLAILEKTRGPEHRDVMLTLDLTARLRVAQKRPGDAVALFQRVLAIEEKLLGPESKDLLKTLDAIAILHTGQRKFREAEPVLEQGLAILEKAHGPDGPELVPWLHKLARHQDMQFKKDRAEPYYRRALAIMEKARGGEHPDILEALAKLAEFYAGQSADRYLPQGEELFRRALAITGKAHGAESVELRRWHDALGGLYQKLRRYDDAEAQYLRSLALVEKAKGPDDREVIAALGKLADIYAGFGNKTSGKAVPVHQRIVAILEKTLPAAHPDIAAALQRLGVAYEADKQRPEAEAAYQRALALLEQAHGPDHPAVAKALDKLGSLYGTYPARDYDKAEPLYKRALAIAEKTSRPDEPSLMVPLLKLASNYQSMRRFAEAEPLYRRVLAIREKMHGPEDPSLRTALENVAEVSEQQGRYDEAEQVYLRIIAIQEKAKGPEDLYVSNTLGKLSKLYSDRGEYAKAEPILRRLLASAEKKVDPARKDVLADMGVHQARNDLGKLLQRTARLPEAEALLRRALESDEQRHGPDDRMVFFDRINLGSVLHDANKLEEAEALLRQALASAERHAPGHEIGRALNALAGLLRDTDKPAEAEAMYRRSLALAEQFGFPPHIATNLGNLALVLKDTGRADDAEPLLRRALAIDEQHFGPDHIEIAAPTSNLASALIDAGRYAEAEPLLRRSLAITEKALDPDHPRVATRLNNLAFMMNKTGRGGEAEQLLRRALAIGEKTQGPDHPALGSALDNFAYALMRAGKLAESREAARRALDLYRRAYGPTHRGVATEVYNLAALHAMEGDWSGSLGLFRDARPALTRRPGLGEAAERTSLSIAVLRQNADPLRAYARALHRVGPQDAAMRAESFEMAQWALQTQAAQALAQMSARFGKSGGPMVDLVRERQNLLLQRHAQDRRLLAAAGEADLSVTQALRDSIAGLDARLDRMDAELASKFPEFGELTNPRPLGLAELQALLAPGEALVQFLDVPPVDRLAGETLVWTVTRDTIVWRSVPQDSESLAASVMALRCGLDRKLWQDKDAGEKCRAALGSSSRRAPRDLPFDVARAHALYQALLGPDEAIIRDKRLLIVPSGPLASLPFGVLVTALPAGAGDAPDYARTAWLGTRQPLSVLPSVASLKALRQLARGSRATKAYLGIGNPLLEGAQQDPLYGEINRLRAQAARDRQRCQAPRPTRLAFEAGRALSGFDALFQGKNADIEQIRLATPLPETADELCDVGQRLGVTDSEILLGDRASEAVVKDLSEKGRLADYRFLHFATHGAVAGELRNAAEPGLILTPPAKGTTDIKALERDDGYLTASEIAALKLDPDWVILSACNTASGASAKAEALSGLARAFFYAGARSLLVSHWEVDSDATVKLVTGAFEALAREPGLSHADVLQRSMLALVNAGGQEAHPAYWAPFIVVGAGGAAPDMAATAGAATASTAAPDLVPPLPIRASGGKGKAAKSGVPAAEKKKPSAGRRPPTPDWEREVFNR